MFYPLFARYCAHVRSSQTKYTNIWTDVWHIHNLKCKWWKANKLSGEWTNEQTWGKILHIEFIVFEWLKRSSDNLKWSRANTVCHQKHKRFSNIPFYVTVAVNLKRIYTHNAKDWYCDSSEKLWNNVIVLTEINISVAWKQYICIAQHGSFSYIALLNKEKNNSVTESTWIR